MSLKWRPIMYVVCFWLAVSWCLADSARADLAVRESKKFASAENAGWMNFAPTHGGVSLHPNDDSSYLTGFVWAENIGWIKLSFDGNGPFANTGANNWGVNVNALGQCSGYAWSEVAGWIVFATSQSQVTIDLATGEMDGYAWSESLGYIHLRNTAPAYSVAFVWQPTVSTTAPSNVSGTEAIAGGTVSDDNGAAVIARGVCWATAANPTLVDSCTTDGAGTGSFTSSITGLTAGTTYYLRAYATNSVGTGYGGQQHFTTSQPTPVLPSVSTDPPSNLTATSVTVGGTVTSAGSSAVSVRGICGGTESSTPYCTTAQGSGVGSFTINYKTLQPGTRYYYRAWADNSQGRAYGSVRSFVAATALPEVQTLGASAVGATSVTVGGSVRNANGAEVTARGICGGLSSENLSCRAADSVALGDFSVSFTNLQPGTTYYYRAYASNAAGSSWGELATVTTTSENWQLLLHHATSGAYGEAYFIGEQVLRYELPNLPATTQWVAQCLADFNGDNLLDILYSHVDNQKSGIALRQQGAAWSYANLNQGFGEYRPEACLDVNGDGSKDLVLRHPTNTQVIALLLSGTSVQSVEAMFVIGNPAWEIRGGGDFDGNGSDDLIARNSQTGANVIARLHAGTIQPGGVQHYSTVTDQAYTIVGVVDVDQDGNLDAIWFNKDSGELYVEYLAGGARQRVSRLADLPVGWEVRGAAQFPTKAAAQTNEP